MIGPLDWVIMLQFLILISDVTVYKRKYAFGQNTKEQSFDKLWVWGQACPLPFGNLTKSLPLYTCDSLSQRVEPLLLFRLRCHMMTDTISAGCCDKYM